MTGLRLADVDITPLTFGTGEEFPYLPFNGESAVAQRIIPCATCHMPGIATSVGIPNGTISRVRTFPVNFLDYRWVREEQKPTSNFLWHGAASFGTYQEFIEFLRFD